MTIYEGSNILLTGGTGTFGHEAVKQLLEMDICKLIIFSRDEYKQHLMARDYPETPDSKVRYILGDVRDYERVLQSTKDIDIIIHAAAMKHITFCEYHPLEAVKTNVMGSANIAEAARVNDVDTLIGISTDKAVEPVNHYGATKLAAERLITQISFAPGSNVTKSYIVRYGNVLGSRGSVLEVFKEQAKTGTLTITDVDMTRFFIYISKAVSFVLQSVLRGSGGEIFIPKMRSIRITDLAKIVSPTSKIKVTGIRPGEKLHEKLISQEESSRVSIRPGGFAIHPSDREFRSEYSLLSEPLKSTTSADNLLDPSQAKEFVKWLL